MRLTAMEAVTQARAWQAERTNCQEVAKVEAAYNEAIKRTLEKTKALEKHVKTVTMRRSCWRPRRLTSFKHSWNVSRNRSGILTVSLHNNVPAPHSKTHRAAGGNSCRDFSFQQLSFLRASGVRLSQTIRICRPWNKFCQAVTLHLLYVLTGGDMQKRWTCNKRTQNTQEAEFRELYEDMASDGWLIDECLSCGFVGSRRRNLRIPCRDIDEHLQRFLHLVSSCLQGERLEEYLIVEENWACGD